MDTKKKYKGSNEKKQTKKEKNKIQKIVIVK